MELPKFQRHLLISGVVRGGIVYSIQSIIHNDPYGHDFEFWQLKKLKKFVFVAHTGDYSVCELNGVRYENSSADILMQGNVRHLVRFGRWTDPQFDGTDVSFARKDFRFKEFNAVSFNCSLGKAALSTVTVTLML